MLNPQQVVQVRPTPQLKPFINALTALLALLGDEKLRNAQDPDDRHRLSDR